MIALLLLIAAAPAEEVLARGGELDGPPAQTTVTEGDELVAFGYSEVPPKSRLQAAFALTDANARAELVKLVRVRVEDSLNAHSTATGTATTTATTEEIESKTREVAHGLLPALPPARHGWRRIKRGDEQVLQIWSRIALAKARLAEAIAIAEGAK